MNNHNRESHPLAYMLFMLWFGIPYKVLQLGWDLILVTGRVLVSGIQHAQQAHKARKAKQLSRPVAQAVNYPEVFTRENNYTLGTHVVVHLFGSEFQIGVLTISIDANNQVQRRLDLDDKALIKKAGGSRFRLAKTSITPNDRSDPRWMTRLENASLREVSAMLEKLTKSKVEVRSDEPAAPKPQAEPTSKGNNVVPAAASHQRKTLTYAGSLRWQGDSQRDGKDEHGQTKTFSQYCIKLEMSDGTPVTLWGADLERAIREADVKLGDTINVVNHGRVPVSLGEGKTGYKVSWEVKPCPGR